MNLKGKTAAVLITLALQGCAMVTVESMRPEEYVMNRRGDVLTTGSLSADSIASLQVIGLTQKECKAAPQICKQNLIDSIGLSHEQKMAALSELWLEEAIQGRKTNPSEANRETVLHAYLESARFAYAYLFYTERRPSLRALEDRQGQVRDYYNFAVQEAVSGYLIKFLNDDLSTKGDQGQFEMRIAGFTVTGTIEGLGIGRGLPVNLRPASTLNFQGLRNQYRREGVGAELVAVFEQGLDYGRTGGLESIRWSETPFPDVTVLLKFKGQTLDEVLRGHQIEWVTYDVHRKSEEIIGNTLVPLAANFSAGYGLWLAESGFAQQSLLTMVGRGEPLEEAKIYLMQPFDPKRRLLIMLHGLGSSPEAWVNVSNEILGDPKLRANFQIWQVYYPTQLPLAFNRTDIQTAIQSTLNYFDPSATSKASSEVVLLGHSMGGVLSRLLVTDSGDQIWNVLLERSQVRDANQNKELEKALRPLVTFKPMPQVSRVVFVAAPHKGTPLAQNRIARMLSGLIKLPATVLGKATEIARLLIIPGTANALEIDQSLTAIDNLSDQDPFIQLTGSMPIAQGVQAHSIIGNNTPDLPLSESNDGVVPYRSASLEWTISEKVIPSWHSVQETPEAILEIRRILHLHLP